MAKVGTAVVELDELLEKTQPKTKIFNQEDLIALRKEKGVDKLLPGITGWAQVNGRNAISWEQKFEYDVWYVEN